MPGEKCDEVQLGRLLQLVLGCAVHCEKKEGAVLCLIERGTESIFVVIFWTEYIQRIMNLEESIQHAVMSAIQEVLLTCLSDEINTCKRDWFSS